MMFQEGDIKWFVSLDDIKTEGYFPVKATSPLCFYTLKGRTSTLTKENIVPYQYLQYCIYTSAENRYYFRFFRAYELDALYFNRKSLHYSGEDQAIENLRNYIEQGTCYILFTKQQVEDTSDVLRRLWKANLTGDGKLPYYTYIELLKESLDLQDYRDYGKSLTGTKTVQSQYEERIKELWKIAFESKR